MQLVEVQNVKFPLISVLETLKLQLVIFTYSMNNQEDLLTIKTIC